MAKHFISGVPRYFEPYVCDCFQNALSAQLSHMGQNPGLVLADYLSFMYSEGEGYLGVNYLFKPNTTVEFTEEELNTSLELVYFPLPVQYGTRKGDGNHSDRITVNMYIENDEKKAFKYVKDLIDNDIPAVAAVDLFYMPYHRAWQKEHGLHYVVITGYDEENEFFELFDKYRLSSSDFDGRLSFEQIKLARSSDNPQNNALMGDYKRPLQNIWVQAVIKDGFKPGREKLGRIISESCKRLSGERKILGLSCGIDMLDVFKRDLQERKAEGIDAQNAYMFRTYYNEALKTIARSR
ncbi:MAG: BtrH N-terminal domain-containing protein, partial [Bacillota bacterium]|nr:BtrH N-terminal domain-containing protein [Bacillota bacterium]